MYRLLIADDEKISRDGLMALNWHEFNISIATIVSNGLDAYNYIENNPVDIVLTDIKMPFMDGIELVQKIHENYPDIITVILSGYDDYNYLRSCLKNNVYDYMLKPLKPEELSNTFGYITKTLDERNTDKTEPSLKTLETKDAALNSKKYIINSATQYIEKHYKEPITLSILAEQVHITPTYLSRILKLELGMGLPDLLNSLRIEKAKTMLQDPSLKINDIAENLGYNSTQYFSRTFKKITGVTPIDFRSK